MPRWQGPFPSPPSTQAPNFYPRQLARRGRIFANLLDELGEIQGRLLAAIDLHAGRRGARG